MLQKNLVVAPYPEEDDRELVMRLAPLYQQNREQAKLEGERLVVGNLLLFRFGSLDNELQAIAEPLLAFPPEEFTHYSCSCHERN